MADHGIDLKHRNIPLIAVGCGSCGLARFFLHREIVPPTNDQGEGDEYVDVTPVLHIAAAKGDAEMVERLLEYGADRGEKDATGQTVRQVVEGKEHARIVELLRD